MSPSTPARRVGRLAAAAAGLTALVSVVGPLDTAAARPRPPRPAFTVSGTGTWSMRTDIGDAVANGRGTLEQRHHGRDRLNVAATVDADDGTFPAPGECETAVATVTGYRNRTLVDVIGDGDLCGTFPDGTSVVAYVFTGTFEVIGGRRPLVGVDGFFEVRLGADGSASIFATDT